MSPLFGRKHVSNSERADEVHQKAQSTDEQTSEPAEEQQDDEPKFHWGPSKGYQFFEFERDDDGTWTNKCRCKSCGFECHANESNIDMLLELHEIKHLLQSSPA